MEVESVQLKESSKLEIVSLMDNTVDFLSSNTRKEVQSFRQWNQTHSEMPFAEHGFSLFIRVFSGENRHTILFDTGVSPNGVVTNAERMGIELSEVSHVVLSHGHYDHFGGLTAAVKAINRTDLPIIMHEDMVKRRGTANSKGEIKEYPTFPELSALYKGGGVSTERLCDPTRSRPALAKIENTKKPHFISDDLACVTGEIPRTVSFEGGLIHNRIYRDGSWQLDPLILDERALVLKVKGKGLVVISGCAHAGIINTIQYAQQITGVAKVYGVFGGFHLAGREFEKRIQPTVEALRKINPELIAPSHCTGWRALYAVHEGFADAFVNNSVGNLYSL